MLLGCSSGAILTRVVSQMGEDDRLLHFRTLDWGMEKLRDVIVILHYVNSGSQDPKKIIASSVTYAGFVGVLTGVK